MYDAIGVYDACKALGGHAVSLETLEEMYHVTILLEEWVNKEADKSVDPENVPDDYISFDEGQGGSLRDEALIFWTSGLGGLDTRQMQLIYHWNDDNNYGYGKLPVLSH